MDSHNDKLNGISWSDRQAAKVEAEKFASQIVADDGEPLSEELHNAYRNGYFNGRCAGLRAKNKS